MVKPRHQEVKRVIRDHSGALISLWHFLIFLDLSREPRRREVGTSLQAEDPKTTLLMDWGQMVKSLSVSVVTDGQRLLRHRCSPSYQPRGSHQYLCPPWLEGDFLEVILPEEGL